MAVALAVRSDSAWIGAFWPRLERLRQLHEQFRGGRDVFTRAVREDLLHDGFDVMWTQPIRMAADLTLEQFVRAYLMASDQGTLAVEADGALLGLVSLDDVRTIRETDWPDVRVRDVMTPREQLATLPPTASADRALEELGR